MSLGGLRSNQSLRSTFRFTCRFLSAKTGGSDGGWGLGLEEKKKGAGISSEDGFVKEMDDFLLSRALEEGFEKSRLFESEKQTTGKPKDISLSVDAIKEAFAVCEAQLEGVDDKTTATRVPEPTKPKPMDPWEPMKHDQFERRGKEGIEFSAKFGTPSPGSIRTDIDLDDLPSAIAEEKMQSGMIQDFLDTFAQPKGRNAAVESFFGPLLKPQVYDQTFLQSQTDQAELVEEFEESSAEKPIDPKGGFRVNVYRNITGSIKQLLVSVRRDILQKVRTSVMANATSQNLEFLNHLLEKLKLADENVRGSLRNEMNRLCVEVIQQLQHLSPDEIGLVCLVFGELLYHNSLLFCQVFTELQKPGTLSTMSNEALAGTVLSLGMLMSTDTDFMEAVHVEFSQRYAAKHVCPIPPNIIGPLLLGCCHAAGHSKAETLSSSLLDTLSTSNEVLDPNFASWSDIAIAMYVSSAIPLWKPDLLKGLHARLTKTQGSWDVSCMESSTLLIALERLYPNVKHTSFVDMWNEVYAMLEDRVGQLIDQNQVVVSSVPDLIRSLSFPGFERLEYFKPLNDRIIHADTLSEELPLWIVVYRLMAGYANVRYRDPELLKALNKRLLASKLALISTSTLAQLLLLGCRLRGLEEEVVNRAVELLVPRSEFWTRLYRAKDAAKIAYSLAGFEKLTPEIFGECWKRCAMIPFDQYPTKNPQDDIDAIFIAQGIFTGYQYIRHRYSASVARKHISRKGHDELYGIIKQKNLTEAGPLKIAEKEVSDCLREMGVSLTSPAIISDGLYRADIVLDDSKVAVFVSGNRSHYTNPPYEPTGFTLLMRRALEALKIKVVDIREAEWNNTALERREQLLMDRFAEQGVDLTKLLKKNAQRAGEIPKDSSDVRQNVAEWLDVRSIVLRGFLRCDLLKLLLERKELLKEPLIDDISQLTNDAMVRNDFTVRDASQKERSMKSKTKSELIRDILHIEV